MQRAQKIYAKRFNNVGFVIDVASELTTIILEKVKFSSLKIQ